MDIFEGKRGPRNSAVTATDIPIISAAVPQCTLDSYQGCMQDSVPVVMDAGRYPLDIRLPLKFSLCCTY